MKFIMEDYVLAAIFAIMIMLFFFFFFIKNVIKRINENSRKYFLDKLQEYDYLIDEKKEEIANLQKQINTLQDETEMKKEVEEYKKHKDEIKKSLVKIENKNKEEEKEEIIYDIPTPKYRQEEFFNSYKKLKKQFDVNSKQILEEFLKEHKDTSEDKKYIELKKLREQFSEETVYELLTLTPEEQFDVTDKVINSLKSSFIKLDISDKKTFSIVKFLEKIDIKIREADPNIYVYVSNDGINYDCLDKRIKTILYKNMSEGIIIEYKNKMYDYSI